MPPIPRDDQRPAAPPSRSAGSGPGGATTLLTVTAAALLLLLGLRTLTRNQPSAATDIRPAPTATRAPRANAPPLRFGQPPFPTARPVRIRVVTPVVVGRALPRRRAAAEPTAAVPTPTRRPADDADDRSQPR